MGQVYFHTMLWLLCCHRQYPRLQRNLHILLSLIWFHSQHFDKNGGDALRDTPCKALLQQSCRLIKPVAFSGAKCDCKEPELALRALNWRLSELVCLSMADLPLEATFQSHLRNEQNM